MMRKFFLAALLMTAVFAGGMTAQAQPYGPGMTGGYGPGYGMMGGWGPGYGMMHGWGPGWMMGGGWGPGWGFGPRSWSGGDLKLGTDQVKKYLERMVAIQGNPRLKVGDVKEKDADTITADVVTKDKEVLVQRFVFNRHNGFYRPEE